ncbi:MAG TPA: TraR/DksA family transcriptional regulator [Burkholderiaceae bacterium]|nr:TraR/DksA family transcriptional regulator [Burkholderiaceae bacterium]
MTKDQIEALRATLVRRLAELRHEISEEVAVEATERYRDIAGEVVDIGDESIAAEITGTDNVIIGRHVDEVRDIEGALARIDAATYGRCIDCGTEVDYARLIAYPTAKRCEACQAVHERTFAEPPHSSL